jgi:ABC-type multidrug transport system fused ATPase/permease subunit
MSGYLQEDDLIPYVKSVDGTGSLTIQGGEFSWSAPATAKYEPPGKRKGVSQFRMVLALLSCPLWSPVFLARVCWRRCTWRSRALESDTVAPAEQEPDCPVRIVLRDVNLEVARGELCILVGAVGAGKTSLLHAALGEMQQRKGSVEIGGTIAYTAQAIVSFTVAFMTKSVLNEMSCLDI